MAIVVTVRFGEDFEEEIVSNGRNFRVTDNNDLEVLDTTGEVIGLYRDSNWTSVVKDDSL